MGVSSAVQVVAAIALSIVLFVIAFSIYNMEMVRAIQEAGKLRRRTDIFKGVKDLALNKNEMYNTLDPAHPTFKNLSMSVNQKGGAEYSYNFWMYLASDAYNPTNGIFGTASTPRTTATDAGLTTRNNSGIVTSTSIAPQPLVLLLRGSKTPYAYKNLCSNNNDIEMKVDVLVKNPLIKLENSGDVLSVEINTQKSPDGVKEKSRDTCDERNTNWEYMNSHRIALKGFRENDELKDKWFMVTVVVQDTYPSDPLPLRNKVRVRIFVNGIMELDKYLDGKLGETSGAASVLKNNNGNLYVAPKITGPNNTDLSTEIPAGKADQVRMADLSYFNHALDSAAITDLFSSGFTKAIAPSQGANNDVTDSTYMDNMSIPGGEKMLSQF